jgi:hypothetical protein
MLTNVIGSRGRVTGRIGPGLVGEVLLPVRGGVEAFYAYAADPEETIETGAQVLVVDFTEPRAVYVQKWASLR